jgi:hypothetical protein
MSTNFDYTFLWTRKFPEFPGSLVRINFHNRPEQYASTILLLSPEIVQPLSQRPQIVILLVRVAVLASLGPRNNEKGCRESQTHLINFGMSISMSINE